MTGGRSGTDRAGVREHVRPGVTRAEEVVANASGENFPVALRVLPAVHRRHLTALYGFARLTDDLGDERLPGMPAGVTEETITATRLKLLDDLQADVAAIYDGLEAGDYEVLADDTSRRIKQNLSQPLTALYPQLANAK